jgi:hypothetical protein
MAGIITDNKLTGLQPVAKKSKEEAKRDEVWVKDTDLYGRMSALDVEVTQF